MYIIGENERRESNPIVRGDGDRNVPRVDPIPQQELTPEQRADNLIHEAEAAKAKIYNKPGRILDNSNVSHKNCGDSNPMSAFQFIAQMDQDYMVVGAHVDELTRAKIIKGEYVDFSKLLPKDRILVEEDGRMELVIRNGKTYWTPVSEGISINNFNRWEQAFQIYSEIYTKQFPHRSSELIQYNHVIHLISLSYTWDNIYSYDKEFRLHLSKHPTRSWAVILQQVWSMKLKDRLANQSFNHGQPQGGQLASSYNKSQSPKSSDHCRRINRGKCKFGASCRYDHHCSYCNKYGHGFFNCHKAAANREKNEKKPKKDQEDNK